jgi:hypothetical protein
MPGKQGEATAFAEKRSAYINENYGGSSRVMVRIGGPIGQVVMVSHFDSLASLEVAKRKVIKDTIAGKFPTAPEGVFSRAEEAIWLEKSD